MYRKLSLCLCLVLFTAVTAVAQDAETNKEQDAKEMSGMSIVGNDEAPKFWPGSSNWAWLLPID